MSILLINSNPADDAAAKPAPAIMFGAAVTNQVDNPGEHPIPEPHYARGSTLPNPAVGGEPASGENRIGWSTGIRGLRQIHMPFTGKIWTAPDVKGEPVQGAVGQNKHANQLWAGVRSQLVEYDGSLASHAASFVGKVS